MVSGSDFSGGFPLVLSNRAAATTAAAAAANPLISAAAAGDPHQAFNYPLEVSERRKGKGEIEPPPKKSLLINRPPFTFLLLYSLHSLSINSRLSPTNSDKTCSIPSSVMCQLPPRRPPPTGTRTLPPPPPPPPRASTQASTGCTSTSW